MIDIGKLFTDTLSGILINLPWFILIIWGVKVIAKKMPEWLRQLHDNQIKEIALQRAISMKNV